MTHKAKNLNIAQFFSNPFYDKRFFHAFLVLFWLNFIVLFYSHYMVLQTRFDFYFFVSFGYRILMFCLTYIALLSLIYWTHLRALQNLLLGFLLLCSAFCFIIEIFVLYNFDTPINPYLMLVAFESNPQEATEFLQTYASWFLCAVYVLALISVFLLYRIKTPDNLKFLKWLYLVILISVVIVHITRMRPSSPDLRYSDMINHIYTTTDDTFKKTYAAFKEYQKIQEQFDSIFTDLQVQKAQNPIDNIVLVIGESTQRGKLSLYGYPLPTTPLLDNLKDSKPNNLFVFSDVISPHAHTHQALSLSLTLANKDSQKQWYEYLNLIDALKLGGYHTISISNQEQLSMFGNAVATILKRADEAIFVHSGDSFDLSKHDEAILPLLDKYIAPPPQQKIQTFFALHLMGTHARYENRYPTSFKIFSARDIDAPDFADKSQIAAYLNATLYGDFILSEIIKRFERSDSIVIYFSDHGEEIYDFRNFIGHSDS
ncbi:phosphoethanolamine transferase, partial [Helicobacter japonicus]